MMGKIHTKAKRAFGLGTHVQHKNYLKKIPRKVRPKTFPSEEGAKKWAAENGMKDDSYSLKLVKKHKRYEICTI
jgi:hypothetical protein